MTDHWERKAAQATANSLIDALVPKVKVVNNEIKEEDCFVRHALETSVRKLAAIITRTLVRECGKKTPGGNVILSGSDLLAIADVLEGGMGTKFYSEQDSGPETESILTLAAIIREVDGGHNKGAADLAESILSHPKAKQLFREHQ